MRFFTLLFLTLLSAGAFAQDNVIRAQLPGAPAPEEATDTPNTAQPDLQSVINSAANPVEPSATPVATTPAAQTPAVVAAPTTPAPDAPTEAPDVPTYEAKKYAVLQTLDKLTARTATMTVPVGQATAVGPLFVDIKSCQKTPPSDLPESVAFLQIWEAKPKPKLKKKTLVDDATDSPSQWVFSGWMFASSPALSAMDHPVYDVWLKDCVNEIAASKVK